MVLFPQTFKPSHSLKKLLLKPNHQIRYNTAFKEVIRHCATIPRLGQPGTWLTPEMQEAYIQLHHQGHAHSVETWVGDSLVGGLYGLAIGRVFYGESMFSLQANASKLAFAHLNQTLCRLNFGLLDCQVYTPHLASLGAQLISREDFLERIQQLNPLSPQTMSGEHQIFPGF